MNILQVDEVTAGYGGALVIFDISLSVEKSRVTALVGRNGAGKTTLLKTIAGFIPAVRGKIYLEGKEIGHLPPFLRARLGLKYIRQDKKVFLDLTVEENLRLAAKPTGRYDDINMVYELFPKLKSLALSRAGNLSGGERQMLLLAQGLIGDPKVILLDEPTEGLAPAVVKDLVAILKELKAAGKTFLLVEQNLNVVKELADTIYALKEGKIVLNAVSANEVEPLQLVKFL